MCNVRMGIETLKQLHGRYGSDLCVASDRWVRWHSKPIIANHIIDQLFPTHTVALTKAELGSFRLVSTILEAESTRKSKLLAIEERFIIGRKRGARNGKATLGEEQKQADEHRHTKLSYQSTKSIHNGQTWHPIPLESFTCWPKGNGETCTDYEHCNSQLNS